MKPQAAILPDGKRLHLHHGPIDLIVDADGPARAAALHAAEKRFATVLDELVVELPALRSPTKADSAFDGAIARRMQAATLPFLPAFVTPMAAVAGSVADTILAEMTAAGALERAYVNNGGDIALHLASKESFAVAIAAGRADRAQVSADMPVRGIATSGWRGRSQSLGVADGVTVFAATAAAADAAATMIANAVDLPGSPKVTREPAQDLFPESDLGARLVTVDVATLDEGEIGLALNRGADFARSLAALGHIHTAHLTVQGHFATVSNDAWPPALSA